MAEPKNKTLTFVDLFSGCGGLSIGFEMAGFTSILACDFWPPANLTFKHNFPHCPLYESDVKELNQEKLSPHIGKIDVVVGGLQRISMRKSEKSIEFYKTRYKKR